MTRIYNLITKKRNYPLYTGLVLLLVLLTNILYAQITPGPSDATTAPPSSTSGAGGILCFGQNIAIVGPQDTGNVDYAAYHWYKTDASGNAQLTSVTGRTYTETTTAPGYYNYQLIVKNAAGCISPISNLFSLYVLPQLSVTVTSLNNSICANTGVTTLTATPSPATGYAFNYQWTRNGVNIPGATASTFTLTGESTPSTLAIGVNVSYTLSSGCTTTGSKNITVTPLPAKRIISVGGQIGLLTSSIPQGSSIVLQSSVDTAVAYQWYKDGVQINGAINQNYSAGTVGSYTVTAFNAVGCPSPQSDGISIVVIPTPAISSVNPASAAVGATITIAGANFSNTSSVSFGNVAATSFTIVSPTIITAVVPVGATGNITVTTPGGVAAFSGFTFIPAPVILSFTPTMAITGVVVTFTGTDLTGATAVSFGGVAAASFTVVSPTSITAVVPAGATGNVSVTTPGGTATLGGFNYIFGLPANNFKLTITSATCKGSGNGSVNITATQPLSYTATITGNGLNVPYPFTDSVTINNLPAGTYSVCMTVAGQSNYQQCYNVVITEPADLSVYSTINGAGNTLNLALTGGEQYNIELNGVLYTTTTSNIVLPLKQGNNDLVVTTNKICQGMVQKTINVSSKIIPYPNPFQSALNLNLGNTNVNNITVEIHSVTDAKLVYTQQYFNQSGILQLDLSGLKNDLYALKLTLDNNEQIFKILKK